MSFKLKNKYIRQSELIFSPENRKSLVYFLVITLSLFLIAVISFISKSNNQPITAISVSKTEEVPVSVPVTSFPVSIPNVEYVTTPEDSSIIDQI